MARPAYRLKTYRVPLPGRHDGPARDGTSGTETRAVGRYPGSSRLPGVVGRDRGSSRRNRPSGRHSAREKPNIPVTNGGRFITVGQKWRNTPRMTPLG